MTSEAWKKIQKHYETIKMRRIEDLFQKPKRFEDFSAEANGILVDFSKTSIDYKAKNLLIELINSSNIKLKRKKLFSGDIINKSENRPVLHWLLRASLDRIEFGGTETVNLIKKVFQNMELFADAVRKGEVTSATDQKFTDIINVGIGGSDLGPRMSVRALTPYHDGPRCHFVSNIDSADLTDILSKLRPETTLVIAASKTFTTQETMINVRSVIEWLKSEISVGFEKHLVAVSTNKKEAGLYGIGADRVFEFPSSIGGRYSMWGPIGLSIMIAIGIDNFHSFLLGAREMDYHFMSERFEMNLPILLAMTGIWHRNMCGYTTRAILPYEHRLSELPAYLQQLDMESNGKRVSVDGTNLNLDTAPIVWGQPGTNGQHAFYQMLHQGTSIVPCEFLVGASGHEEGLNHHHELLIANCLAQSQALMSGSSSNKINEGHRIFLGDRPSVTIAYPKLTPKILGSLIALFEHRTFVEGIVWNINSFDQWGVELGKELANELLNYTKSSSTEVPKNQSTAGLLKKLRSLKH